MLEVTVFSFTVEIILQFCQSKALNVLCLYLRSGHHGGQECWKSETHKGRG